MNLHIKKIYYTIFAFLLLLPVSSVFAEGETQLPCKTGELCNPIKYGSIKDFLTAILDAVVIIAFPFIVLAIIYAGFLFISAHGNEEKLKRAKTIFFWVIIGALVILGASVLSLAIQGTIEDIQGSSTSYEVMTHNV